MFSQLVSASVVANLVEDISTQSSFETVHDRVETIKARTRRKSKSSAVPIFYRCQLMPAISLASPSLLIDVIQSASSSSQDIAISNERNVFISVYNLTHRFDPDSKWIDNLHRTLTEIGAVGSDSSAESMHASSSKESEGDTGCPNCERTELTRVSELQLILFVLLNQS